jgi:predicted TIM-barrel fold metal-dependent hydrolase
VQIDIIESGSTVGWGMEKIWTNSGDGHVFEPSDIWTQGLSAEMALRAPSSKKAGPGQKYNETWVDGELIRRQRPEFIPTRPPGTYSLDLRLQDMNQEGVWAELIFPSNALHCALIRDEELWAACCRVYNDWLASEVVSYSPRFVGVAMIPMLDVNDAIAEAQRAVGLGCRGVLLCDGAPEGLEYNLEIWEPFWSAIEELGVPLCVHIGTAAPPPGKMYYNVTRGPGSALINYCESGYPCIRTISHLVSAGVLERHPNLRVTVAESGATWVPYLGDRLDEAYRQHSLFAFPKLEVRPSEILRRQVYTSFQHDQTAVDTVRSLRFTNVMWGTDYPHLEGTFPNSQKVLHELLGDAPADIVGRITQGAFRDLFEVPDIPAELIAAG